MLKPDIQLQNKTILVTGAAGFIGAALVGKLLTDVQGVRLVGLDNMSDYYDTSIKEYRLFEIGRLASELPGSGWTFVKGSIADRTLVERIFAEYKPEIVVNLAAQAGVRYSITNPDAYIESNIIGFYNILEACRNHPVAHLVYASSSSVYGSNEKIPYSTDDKTDNPVSLYAATKKSNELFAHAYSKLYDIPSTGLRFFTVYGPAGRPDMAYFGFTDKLLKGEIVKIFNYGNCMRDFTYIDDIVGLPHRILVMLNDDNGISQIAEFFQRIEKFLIIALMKTDARFVENIQNAHKGRTYLRCKPYSLRFASRQRCRRTRKGKIAETDVLQKHKSRFYFLYDLRRDLRVFFRKFKIRNIFISLCYRKRTEFKHIEVSDRNRAGNLVEPRSAAILTEFVAHQSFGRISRVKARRAFITSFDSRDNPLVEFVSVKDFIKSLRIEVFYRR